MTTMVTPTMTQTAMNPSASTGATYISGSLRSTPCVHSG